MKPVPGCDKGSSCFEVNAKSPLVSDQVFKIQITARKNDADGAYVLGQLVVQHHRGRYGSAGLDQQFHPRQQQLDRAANFILADQQDFLDVTLQDRKRQRARWGERSPSAIVSGVGISTRCPACMER